MNYTVFINIHIFFHSKKAQYEKAFKLWYEEIDDYSYATEDSINGKMVGHFTQVIWKKSVKLCMTHYVDNSK